MTRPSTAEASLARGDLAAAVRQLTAAFDAERNQPSEPRVMPQDPDGADTVPVEVEGDWRAGEPVVPQGSGNRPDVDDALPDPRSAVASFEIATLPGEAEAPAAGPAADEAPEAEVSFGDVPVPASSEPVAAPTDLPPPPDRTTITPASTSRRRALLDDLPSQFRPPRRPPATGESARMLLDDLPAQFKRKAPESRTLSFQDTEMPSLSPNTTATISPDKKAARSGQLSAMITSKVKSIGARRGANATFELTPFPKFVRQQREALLVGTSRSKEETMSRLPEAEQRKFIDAMGDEWCKWEQFKATYDLTEKEIAQYIAAGHRVVGTR